MEFFPLSKTKEITGNRRLVREKVLQILVAYELSGTELDLLYSAIFFRMYNFDANDTEEGKLLRPDEIYELEADIPIIWKNEEIEFARSLLNSCLELRTFTDNMIKSDVENWELDRLALIDRILILIAVSEFIKCPNIPEKVTLNEVLDIAKKYSTDKSHLFINGILDSFRIKLKEDGKIQKTGKGLLTE